jgi:hypothetical protein
VKKREAESKTESATERDKRESETERKREIECHGRR